MTIASNIPASLAASDNSVFDGVARAVAERFNVATAAGAPLFTTDATGLYDLYLDSLPAGERQHHSCNCCRQFIERYGHLVTIDDEGRTHSAFWDTAEHHGIYHDAVYAMRQAVLRADVTGVFLSDEKVWGTPVTGEWHHFGVRPAASYIHKDRLLTPHQVMAQKKQDFGTLSHGLAEFNRDVVAAAVNLLESDTLFRSEKVLGPARFLLDLHDQTAGLHGRQKFFKIWKAVSFAPPGFATPRSSMIGTLLEDIATPDMSLDAVKKRFADKMNPTQYLRPQAPARAGNIVQAEQIVEKLGIAGSLRRRFARLDEVQLIWSPEPPKTVVPAEGVFGHLKAAKPTPSQGLIPAKVMTWVKFAADVLPKAEAISVKLPSGRMSYCGLATAVDPEAPPILQWDLPEARNPVSWYVYTNGSLASEWGLVSGARVDVTGVTLKPSMWSGNNHHGNGVILILDGAKDARSASLALFPETLKAELHSIRSTIEAFSKAGQLEDVEQGNANGLMIGANGCEAIIRVTTSLGTVDYKIDRWD